MDQAHRPSQQHRQPRRPGQAVEVRGHRAAPGARLHGARRGVAPAALPHFAFTQLVFPFALGPSDGRYVLRRHAGEEPDHVFVLSTLGATQRRLMSKKRPRKAAPEPPPEPVRTARATLIDTAPFDDEAAAKAWLSGVDGEQRVAAALPALNRVLHLHRVAAADPGPRDVTRELAIIVRVGYGVGDQVADGRYAEAVTLPDLDPAKASRKTAALRPQERLAALLSGRDAALACEELALRARADLDAGRVREAALTLRVALEAALAELEPWAERGDLRQRIVALAEDRFAVGAAANRALQGGLDEEEAAGVSSALGHIEAALRARTAGGIDWRSA